MSIYEYNNTKMYYETIGEGTPFLLIHGWALDHRFLRAALEPAFAKCKRNFQRIYIDVPGMGISEPGDIKNADGILEVLISFMNDKYPNTKFCVGGNSFGSHITRGLLAKCPENIEAALLLCPSTGDVSRHNEIEPFYIYDREWAQSLSEAGLGDFTCMNANITAEAYERYKKDVVPSVEINKNNEFMHKVLKGKFGFDLEAAARKLKYKGPVMIIVGKCDTIVGYKEQFEWLDIYPHASFAVIDGAGHNMNIDRPELFEGFVSAFLAAI